jgi:hypothetical protein
LGAALVSSLVGVLAVEVGLRASGRGPIPAGQPSLLSYFWVRDPRLGFRNRPGGELDYARAGCVVRTGAFGARLGVRAPSDAARATVVFVGDSTSFCGEVGDDETGPSEVARRLPPGLDASVVNTGVCGYNTLQALRMAAEWLGRSAPKLVVYTYCDNDWVENVIPTIQQPARSPVATITSSAALRIVEVPQDAGHWGEPVGSDPPPSARDLVAARSAVATQLVRAFERVFERPDLSLWEKGSQWAETKGHAAEVLAGLLAQLRDLCREHGAALLVTRFTTGRASVFDGRFPDTHEKLERACREANVRYVDIAPAFTRPANDYRAHLAGGVIDAHYGSLGTRTYGEALAPHVLAALEGR